MWRGHDCYAAMADSCYQKGCTQIEKSLIITAKAQWPMLKHAFENYRRRR
jgi:hypothetical protein